MSNEDESKAIDVPEGFEPCHTGYKCPSCNSSLISKIAPEPDDDKGQLSLTETNTSDKEDVNCSLRTAKIANLLLTALSFDRSTRDSSSPKEVSRIVPGVSYCPECKVHVVVESDELELLFPNDNSEEWLRGSLYVAVDDTEVDALLTSQTQSQQEDVGPKRPQEFDYDYRHKVATKTMGSKMTKEGYTLTEEICEECEMPMMKKEEKEKECVVCPKLWLKVKQRDGLSQGSRIKPILKAETHSDPISAIIAEARRATEPKVKPKASSLEKILGERAAAGAAISISGTESTSHASTLTSDEMPHHGHQEVSVTNSNGISDRSMSWEKLLVSGRLLLTKRMHQGWIFSERNCRGSKCNGTPLMRETSNSKDVCMVCGGGGSGFDGYYASEKGELTNLTVSHSEEEEPNWEALIEQGRSLLAQRLQQGWTMTTENCGGYRCNDMPLIKLDSEQSSSCVVCGGTGSGCDGIYEKFRSNEVVNAERELVSQEISHLMSMGWILRDSLCQQCLMPLVAESEESDDLCILCGIMPSNRIVNRQIAEFNDDVSNEAGKRLKMGYALPAAPLCLCGGLQMIPPNSSEMGCIMPGCTFALPEPNVECQNRRITYVGRGAQYLNGDATAEDAQNESPCDNTKLAEIDESFPFNYVRANSSSSLDDPSVLSDDLSQVRSVASR